MTSDPDVEGRHSALSWGSDDDLRRFSPIQPPDDGEDMLGDESVRRGKRAHTPGLVNLVHVRARQGLPSLPAAMKRATTPIPFNASSHPVSRSGRRSPNQLTKDIVPSAEPVHQVEGLRDEVRPAIASWPALDRPDSRSFIPKSNALLPKGLGPMDVAAIERAEADERLEHRRREISKTQTLEQWGRRPGTQSRPGTRELVSRGGTSSSGALVASSDPPILTEIQEFKEQELRLVRANDPNGKVRVYREVMQMLISKFNVFGPLLQEIQTAYDTRLEQCEDMLQQFMLGDKAVQLEKEKYLALQNDAIACMEKEREETSTHRKAVVAAEQQIYHLQHEQEKIKEKYEQELADLRKELLMERAVRRDEADNKNTYSRMHAELRDRWEEATKQLVEFKQSVKLRMDEMEISERKALSDYHVLRERMRSEHAEAEARYNALQASTVSPEEYAKMRDRSKRLLESLRVLEKKVQWLQSDLDAKSNYEVAIPWRDIGSEYADLKREGRSSEGIVRIILQKLSRANKYEKQFFSVLKGYYAMRDYIGSSEYARLSNAGYFTEKFGTKEDSAPASLMGSPKTSKSKLTKATTITTLGPLLQGHAMPPAQVPQAEPVSVQLGAKASSTIQVVPSRVITALPSNDAYTVPKELAIRFLTSETAPWAPQSWVKKSLGESVKGSGDNLASMLAEGPSIADNKELNYAQVKQFSVAAFVVCASQGISLPAAFESVTKAHYDFTSQPEWFANVFTAMSECFIGDPFIEFSVKMLRGERQAKPFAAYFLNTLRLLYTCWEKTEKLLTGGAKSTGTLPRKVLHECLAQCLPHKSAKQMIRLQHAIHTVSPATTIRNTFFRDLFGSFTQGKPSPLLIELADQFVDEVYLFGQIVTYAVQTQARDVDPEGRVTPTSVAEAIRKGVKPTPKPDADEDAMGSSLKRRKRRQSAVVKISTGTPDTSSQTPPTPSQTLDRSANVASLSVLDDSALAHEALDNLSVVQEELPDQLIEYWVALAFSEGQIQPAPSVAPPTIDEDDEAKKVAAEEESSVRIEVNPNARAPCPDSVPMIQPLELPRCTIMEDGGAKAGGSISAALSATQSFRRDGSMSNVGTGGSASQAMANSIQAALSVVRLKEQAAKAKEDGKSRSSFGKPDAKEDTEEKEVDFSNHSAQLLKSVMLSGSFSTIADTEVDGVNYANPNISAALSKAIHNFSENTTLLVRVDDVIDAMWQYCPMIPLPHIVIPTPNEAREESMALYNMEAISPSSGGGIQSPVTAVLMSPKRESNAGAGTGGGGGGLNLPPKAGGRKQK